VKEKFSALEDKQILKKVTEEYIEKKLNCCEKTMQELCDFLKKPNVQILCIEKKIHKPKV
jgi:dihydroneopterin aldolase